MVRGLTAVQKNEDVKQQGETTLSQRELDSIKYEEMEKTKMKPSRTEKTIKWLLKEDKKKNLRFDKAIQRGEAWNLEQKSGLIHSILYGYPIPPVLIQDSDDDFYWFLDGKQRVLMAIISYLKGEYALGKNTEDVYGIKIAGYKFNDLPETMKDAINDASIQLTLIKNITEEEVDKLFVKWNSGTPLRKIELIRAMHSSLIEQIKPIKESTFFSEDIYFSKSARAKLVDEEIIFTVAMIMEQGKDNIKGISPAQIKEYITNMKDKNTLIPAEIIANLENINKYMQIAHEQLSVADAKKVYKKVNLPIIIYTAKKAMDLSIKPNIYGEFLRIFLVENYSKNTVYGVASQTSTTKKGNVLKRLNEMENALDLLNEKLKEFSSNTIKATEEFAKENSKIMKEQEQAKADEIVKPQEEQTPVDNEAPVNDEIKAEKEVATTVEEAPKSKEIKVEEAPATENITAKNEEKVTPTIEPKEEKLVTTNTSTSGINKNESKDAEKSKTSSNPRPRPRPQAKKDNESKGSTTQEKLDKK